MAYKKEVYGELETLAKIQDERNNIHIDWIKTVLTISTSVTAIIISFKGGKSESNLELISYLVTISLSGIGILAGLIHLFGYVVLHNRSLTNVQNNILQLLNDKNVDKFSRADTPKYHKISEKICVLCLLISFVSLIIYGISIAF
jgi:hypothetical protein